jgi:hypothetical protein
MDIQILHILNNSVLGDAEPIFIKPLCDFFGINPKNQEDKIKNGPILAKSSLKKPMKTTGSNNHPDICPDKKEFVRWAQTISPNIVATGLGTRFTAAIGPTL